MLTAEYDYETDIEVQRGEAYDEGREEGKLEEKKNLIKNLYEAKFTVAEISKLLKTKEDEVEKDYKIASKRELIVVDQLSFHPCFR